MENDIVFAIKQLLSQQKKEEKYLDSSEVCKLLGISKSTLYKYNFRKEIPYFKRKNSKKVYYLYQDILNFMSQIRVASKYEISEQAKSIINKHQ